MGDRSVFVIRDDDYLEGDSTHLNALACTLEKGNIVREVNRTLMGVGLLFGWAKGSYPSFLEDEFAKLDSRFKWTVVQESGGTWPPVNRGEK